MTFSGAYPQLLLPPSSSAAVWTLSPPAHYLLPYPGTNSQCGAADINIHGQIVGWANYDQFAGHPYATLWNGSVITRLNDLVDPSLGWSLDSASAINDHGQIAGMGSINGKAASWFMTPHLEVTHAEIPLQFLQILFGIRNDTPGVLRRPDPGRGRAPRPGAGPGQRGHPRHPRRPCPHPAPGFRLAGRPPDLSPDSSSPRPAGGGWVGGFMA